MKKIFMALLLGVVLFAVGNAFAAQIPYVVSDAGKLVKCASSLPGLCTMGSPFKNMGAMTFNTLNKQLTFTNGGDVWKFDDNNKINQEFCYKVVGGVPQPQPQSNCSEGSSKFYIYYHVTGSYLPTGGNIEFKATYRVQEPAGYAAMLINGAVFSAQ